MAWVRTELVEKLMLYGINNDNDNTRSTGNGSLHNHRTQKELRSTGFPTTSHGQFFLK